MGYVIKRQTLAGRTKPLQTASAALLEGALEKSTAAFRINRDRERIAEIAVRMAERIVGETLETRPALLDTLFERAMREIGDLRPGRIHVHPDDRRKSAIDALAAARGLEVIEDEEVGRSGCRVEACGAVSDHALPLLLDRLRLAARGQRD